MYEFNCFANTRQKGNFHCLALDVDNCLNCKFYKTIEQVDDITLYLLAQERRKKYGSR